jgi:hypothetical protein
MASRQLGRLLAKVTKVASPRDLPARAAAFAALLKAEYEAGLRGQADQPIDSSGADTDITSTANEVADAMGAVDWAAVKSATAKGAGEAAERMRAMAAQVDWDKVQPVAAQVSSALIAALASGQIPLGGPLTGRVARTIMNDQNLAQKVADTLARTPASMPPDFRGVIDTTGTER